ncbi:class I SAM-dependent DNA methyltransferase [Flavobacterium sp.]|jgi:type II restriction/modification system DNA methylase subunit YeeA|uniref:class I SAM-dependent DNA methyltransferase n=1 Tax=Flavobacterium sp. TaxID=239 RepID=UPI0037BF4635
MLLEPRKALNKAFLKIKPNRTGIELFKQNLILLLDSIKEKESEEFHKNLISDFLKNTYYSPNHFINTKGRNDLVIHTGKEAKSNVGVIIEAKSPSNKAEMLSQKNLNSKALQELVLYFLRERISHKNLEVKHLVATNLNEWYLFDAQLFDKLFAQNKTLVKQFQDFEEGKLSGTNTDFFYKEIAKPFIETLLDKLEYTYFDLATYDKILRNSDKQDDTKLIVLYKLLSPEHLLKLSFANDSNSLDKNFYNELLHLIGLTETKEGGKKLIERPKAGQRHAGSLLENVINQLDSLDKLSRLPNVKQYGDTHEERLFTVGLELCITWVNRILFLKLLEAQLISYAKGDKSYAFLHKGLLHDYDNLNALFFMVLAKKPEERNDRVKTLFAKVPYLNSSLFEPTELEHQTLFISGLEDDIPLPLLSGTVLKDANGKKLSGTHKAIDYFFDFLDAYDFASEGSEDIQEDNKTLINASVLGLIFEKINGYKDGSFYTPSFITMYMCKETIRRAVVQKFNETKGWNCEDFEGLYNKIEDTKEANAIINSVKICDPAVGSGHFLVSALNEMIAIKHDLKVLTDREGKRLKEYQVDIVNDELIVTDEDGVPFTYNPKSKESQRLQETLFHEKQTIIENCLFGVDINPNSVKICRLRLWIELLKNAYYRNETELETLPNIDINIKCGNSLIARFGLDADLKEALKKSKLKIDDYKRAVDQYRNAESKEQKRDMETVIAEIKTGFSSNIDNPFKDKIKKARWEVNKYETEINTKEQWGDKIEKSLLKEFEIAKKKFQKLEEEQEEIKNNKIYEDAFEWRFEFPEVLNDQGDFVGFDVVIGNPPYVQLQKMGQESISLEKMNFETYTKTGDIYSLFYELGFNILCKNGLLTFITSNKWMRAAYGESLRNYFVQKTNPILLVDFGGVQVFDTATVDTNILMGAKSKYDLETKACLLNKDFDSSNIENFINTNYTLTHFKNDSWVVLSSIEKQIKDKIEKIGTPLKDWDIQINYGIKTGYNEAFIIDGKKRDELIKEDPKSVEIIRPILRGRDIKKYSYDFADLYLINTHNGIKEKGISPVDINNYPAIKKHLDLYLPQLEKRQDKGDTMYNLRNCAYIEDFSKQKIIFQEMVQESSFILDLEGKFICLDTARIITGSDLEVLISILNSDLFFYCIKTFYGGGGLGETGVRMKHTFFENFPVPWFTENQKNKLRKLIKNPTKENLEQINAIIYDSYNLENLEIKAIKFQ